MVKGLDVFHDYFREYNDQYVLIGGAACSISFEKQDLDLTTTLLAIVVVLNLLLLNIYPNKVKPDGIRN